MFNNHQLTHINFIHNSLFSKFLYTYFGGLNHIFRGSQRLFSIDLTVITYVVIYIYVEYEWSDIVHFLQYCKISYYKGSKMLLILGEF
jgi:hypothetical protein